MSEDHIDEASAEAVRAQLRALSAAYEPMPDSVAHRLDATLAELPPPMADAPPPVAARPAIPWWRRRFAPLALGGAFSVIAVMFGLAVLLNDDGGDDGSATTAQEGNADAGGDAGAGDGEPDAAAEEPAPEDAEDDSDREDEFGTTDDTSDGQSLSDESVPTVTYSDTEYHRNDDLASILQSRASGSAADIDDDLRRLADDPNSLAACFAEITAAHGGDVSTADFGYLDGQPAVITMVVAGGDRTIVVVGPDCGGLTGTDQLFVQ